MPLVALCTAVGTLAIAGMPPLCIFDSEWMIFSGGFHTAHLGLSIAALLGSLLTVAYSLWFLGRVFFGARPEGVVVTRPLPLAMSVPTILLTILALVEGVFPAPVFNWVEHALSLVLGGQW
jgi:NADH:ubiquinone oxidoreductase subunit 4 (subunit M)